MLDLFIILGALLSSLIIHSLTTGRRRGNRYPPGPEPRWFGRTEATQGKLYIQYTNLAKLYGPLVNVQSYGMRFFIVSSAKIADDLLEKRSNLYSDRIVSPVTKMVDMDWLFSLMPYGDTWRKHRRIFHQAFKPEAVRTYRPLQSQKVHEALKMILRDPSRFQQHYYVLATSVILSLVYDYDVKRADDEFVTLAEKALNALEDKAMYPGVLAVHGLQFLEYLPSWFPGASYKRAVDAKIALSKKVREMPLKILKDKLAASTANPCLGASLLERYQDDDETMVQDIAAVAYLGTLFELFPRLSIV
ncbi:hypothetical protein HGRIS_003141 [Hohenbuehelia grisea]|uniref:Cytochrome P450 n=1 Tax=Hohenbuehelia grisea TaxID=104357 RepID=A0ABR3JPQ0_9AGAR